MDKKKKIVLIVVIVLLLLLSGVIVFITSNDKKITEEGKESDILTEEELLALGKELFAKTEVYSSKYIFYENTSNSDVTYGNMSNIDRLMASLLNIPATSFTYNTEDTSNKEKCFDSNQGWICYSKKISKDIFESYYKELFGSDKSINYETIADESEEDICKLEDNDIICYPSEVQVDYANNFIANMSYNTTEQVDDTIYLYTNVLVLDVTNNNLLSGFNGNVIEGVSDTEKEILKRNVNEEQITKIVDKYQEQSGKYKLTFKKDTNNNWYWTKTEAM